MSQTSANLIDRVFPEVPVRQWVISLPIPIRFLMAKDPSILDAINSIINQVISSFYKKRAKAASAQDPESGAITFIQRAGGSINLNPHFHLAVIEGAFDTEDEENPRFVAVSKPTDNEVSRVLKKICQRVVKFLVKSRLLSRDEEGYALLDEFGEQNGLDLCHAASIRQLVAFGPRAGKRVLRLYLNLGKGTKEPTILGPKNASLDGFSIHANTFIEKNDRHGLEALLRYMARPAIANERFTDNGDGTYDWRLKTPYSDGTIALRFTGLEIVEKIASIIPPPWKNLVRYWGCFAPNSKIRKAIIPKEPLEQSERSPACSTYIPWAELLRRVFKIDITSCILCGGKLRFVSVIFKRDTITKILSHLGMNSNQGDTGPPRFVELEYVPI